LFAYPVIRFDFTMLVKTNLVERGSQ